VRVIESLAFVVIGVWLFLLNVLTCCALLKEPCIAVQIVCRCALW
jgi:hypothetical protein